MSAKGSGRQTMNLLHPTWISAVLLLVGLVATGVYWQVVRQQEQQTLVTRFNNDARRVVANLTRQLHSYSVVMRGVQGLFQASEQITYAEFRQYADALDVSQELEGVQALAFVQPVDRADLERHEAAASATLGTEYRVHPRSVPSTLAPIVFIHPLNAVNRRALGFNVFTTPEARAAASRSRDSGELAITAPLALVQDIGQPNVRSFVFFLPVYTPGEIPSTVEERRRRLVGWVDVPFRMVDLVAGLQVGWHPDIALEIHDAGLSAPKNLLYRRNGLTASQREAQGELLHREALEVGGRQWDLTLASTPAYRFDNQSNRAASVLGSGILMSLLLAALVYRIARDREHSERRAEGLALRLSTLLENVGAGVYQKDAEGRFTFVNRKMSEMLGVPADQLVGQGIEPFIDVESAERHRSSDRDVMERRERVELETSETAIRTGEPRVLWNVKIPLLNADGTLSGLCGIATDVTERKVSEARLRYLSDFDALTGLPNRQMLEDRARTILDVSRATGDPVALFYIDLDRFKIINQSMGHSVGDEVLQALAARLTSVLDFDATLSRLAGDQFLVLLPGVSASGASDLAREIIELLASPIVISGRRLAMTASVGIACFPEHGDSVEQLAQSANAALSLSKQRGGNTVAVFSEALYRKSHETLQLQNDLRDAVASGQMSVFYQPQVDITSGAVIGAEALLRWHHPELGNISPGRFVPLAEEAGLITDIGNWAMRTAAEQFVRWQELGLGLRSVAVNLSAMQLYREDFSHHVRGLVTELGLAPGELELELTERIAMRNSKKTEQILVTLREMGVALSIDDFGKGYSSLSYLKRYPLNKLKIDKAFIDGVLDGGEDAAIVRAIIALAQGLGFSTVAEGVEHEAQLMFLREAGCDAYQGYLFSRPVTREGFESLLADRRQHSAG